MKTRILKTFVCLAAAALVAPASVAAQGPVSVTVKFGVEPLAGGVMHEGGTGVALGLAAAVDEKTWDDTHERGIRLDGSVGVSVGGGAEIFGAFEYGRADGQNLQVGTVAGLALTADFTRYQYWGVGGGARYLFSGGAATPYLTGQAGLRRVDAIQTTLRVRDAGVVLPNLAFYGESTVPTFGAGAGLLFGSGRAKIGVEAAFHWAGGLEDQAFLAGTGLENLNDAGSRWSMPVSVVVRF